MVWVGLLLAVFFVEIQSQAVAQNAPITTAATVNGAVPGQQVTVPVTVTGFVNIGSITLTLDYDHSKLHFVSATKNPALVGSFSVGDNDLGNGMHRLIMGWFGSGVSLPDGSPIVNYVFEYLSGVADINWYENGQSCEYTDDFANILNDTPTSEYYFNGRICGAIANPGSISGLATVCEGLASVSYSIQAMSNVIGYDWSVPPGAVITSGMNSNSITVDYLAGSVSGNVTVSGLNECGSGPQSSLPVTVNPLPLADAGEDISIGYSTSTQLHAASGGTGTCSYHWSPEALLVNPNVQEPFTVQLTASAVFHLVVTNTATLCAAEDEMAVTISGGPLGVNPVAVPPAVCKGEFIQLYANAGGGSGSYTYSWTCIPPGSPPWSSTLQNPVVSPDTSTLYLLTVNDGFNLSSGSANVTVYQLPQAVMSGGGTICDDGSTALLRIDLQGEPPWSFVYSNGLNATTITNLGTTPYLSYTSEPGTYAVLSVNDLHCSGYTSGSATVNLVPVPVTPLISWNGTILSSDAPDGNQWYHNDTLIPGATNQVFIPIKNGAYYCIVGLNGCISDTSNVLDILVTSGLLIEDPEVFLYPNPAKEYFYLQLQKVLNKSVKVSIFSFNGLLNKEFIYSDITTPSTHLLDIRELPPGLYLVRITAGGRTKTLKIVVT